MEEILEFIDSIINDKILLEIIMDGSKVKRSGIVYLENIETYQKPNYKLVYTYTWSGIYSR